MSSMSSLKVISLPIDFLILYGFTGLLSIPLANSYNILPLSLKISISSSSENLSKSSPLNTPILFSLFLVTLPTPKNFPIGKFLIKSFEFSSIITVIPSGFLKSDAIFAKNLLKETPAEAVRPTSLNILSFISRAIKVADPLHLLLLLTSTKASSKDKGSTRLEYSFNIFITCLETFL